MTISKSAEEEYTILLLTHGHLQKILNDTQLLLTYMKNKGFKNVYAIVKEVYHELKIIEARINNIEKEMK